MLTNQHKESDAKLGPTSRGFGNSVKIRFFEQEEG
jgi:hypothetical protein